MRKFTSVAAALTLAFGVATSVCSITSLTNNAYAKSSYSGGSSFRSPSFSRPSFSRPSFSRPSSSYSKPVESAPARAYSKPDSVLPSTASTSKYSKPTGLASTPSVSKYSKPGGTIGSTTPNVVTQRVVSPSALSAQSSKVMSGSAFSAYQADRRAAKLPPQGVNVTAARTDPTFSAATHRYSSVNSYMAARSTSMSAYRQAHPNVYIIANNMHPNYGAYDSSFLTGMIFGVIGSEAANANWLYMHQNDPWYAQYHADLVQQAQNNAELQAKLNAMDAQMAALRDQHVVINQATSQLPAGIDPSLAIAPEAMIANATVAQSSSSNYTLLYMFIIMLLIVMVVIYYLYVKGSQQHRR